MTTLDSIRVFSSLDTIRISYCVISTVGTELSTILRGTDAKNTYSRKTNCRNRVRTFWKDKDVKDVSGGQDCEAHAGHQFLW